MTVMNDADADRRWLELEVRRTKTYRVSAVAVIKAVDDKDATAQARNLFRHSGAVDIEEVTDDAADNL